MTARAVVAIALLCAIAADAGAEVIVPRPIGRAAPTCTFGDGTIVQGTFMFDEEFNTGFVPDATVWLAEDTWPGPLLETPGDIRCMRHENATVSGGVLHLAVTNSARGSCPQAWSVTPFYTANYGGGYTPGATTRDIASINTKTFRFQYGHIQMRIKMPPSGGDVSLWGVSCQKSIGVVGALSDLFTATTGARVCDWPNPGSREVDVIQNSNLTLNTSWYRESGQGAPFVFNWTGVVPPGIDAYGHLWSTHGALAFSSTFLGDPSPSDPTANYHIYDLDWEEGFLAAYVDGFRVSIDSGASVTAELMFPMIWNINVNASEMLVDYIRIWCKPGRTCTFTN